MTRGRVDVPVVRRHLGALRATAANLRRHEGRSAHELGSDPDLRWVVERGLQIGAQNALDVATHLVSAAGLDAPDYASAIDRLVKCEVLAPEFGARFGDVAGFRDVLVRAYLDIDLEVMARVLSERLDDFEELACQVEARLGD